MAYNEKELEQMITVIKNLKQERNDALKNNASAAANTSNSKDKDGVENKDTSFYSRIFHQDKGKSNEFKKKDISALNINNQVKKDDTTKQDLEEIVRKVMLEKAENQEFIQEMVTAIIKEYSSTDIQQHIINEIKQQIEEEVAEQVNKIIKDVMHNIAQSLMSL